MLAAYHGHPQAVSALLERGADPTAGIPSAVEAARMFGLDDLVALFEGRAGRWFAVCPPGANHWTRWGRGGRLGRADPHVRHAPSGRPSGRVAAGG
jgi:hypothetical protein